MGKHITYYGGNTIINTRKKHRDCSYLSQDGDCMNRSSVCFGAICREIGSSCKDISPRYSKSEKGITNIRTDKDAKKKSATFSKPLFSAQIGDTIIIHSFTHNKDVTLEISQSQTSRSPIAEWAIGKTLGSKGSYNGNDFELKRIVKKSNDKR